MLLNLYDLKDSALSMAKKKLSGRQGDNLINQILHSRKYFIIIIIIILCQFLRQTYLKFHTR